ncbi:MAG: response regulator [Bacteroidota bacterium]
MEKKNEPNEIQAIHQSHAWLLQKLSHDLLIPMNGIVAMCQESKKAIITEENEATDTVIQTVNNLISVVQGMSVYASLLKDELRSEEKIFSIKDLFSELESLHRYLAETNKVEVNQEYVTDVPEKLSGDYRLIRQLLSGFLSNALKHTKKGWVNLSAEVLKMDSAQITIRFMVKDSGNGINEEKLQKIRTALKSATKPDLMISEDIGLGLVLGKIISERLGGSFDFESKPSAGSAFWIDVPLKPEKIESEPATGKHPFKTENPKRILLVEDNYLNQKFVAAALLKAGHSIEIAENGKVALDKFHQKSYDLILMDIQMPLFDGIETTQRIRKEEAKFEHKKTPIVAVTAYAIEHDRQKCLNAGMDEYLTKPFKPEELLQIINEL